MFVSFSVGNTGPFKEVTGITTVCESLKKEFLGKNTFEVGGHIQIWGRVQSREYVKKINEEESEKHVAYEVSVSKLEYIDE